MALLPGCDFGRDERELTARLAFVDFDGSQALPVYPEQGSVDEAFLGEHCSRTIEAVRRVVDWLANL